MIDPGWRDAAASELLIRHVDSMEGVASTLLIGDPRGEVTSELDRRGIGHTRWSRRASESISEASVTPPSGPFGAALLRLPRAKDELDMAANMAAAELGPGGRLLVYGTRDEGIASSRRILERIFGSVTTVARGRRSRVLEATSPRTEHLRPALPEWRTVFDPGMKELGPAWVSYPGVFANGRVDGGTALLVRSMTNPASGLALDFGCGNGIVGAVARARSPELRVHFLDVDAVALSAVEENVGGATTVLSFGWRGVPPETTYDCVLSNPPIHLGKAQSLDVIQELIDGCRRHLHRRGSLTLVVQRRLGVERVLEHRFRSVEHRGDEGPWRVIEASSIRS